jgi:hypothetical protein
MKLRLNDANICAEIPTNLIITDRDGPYNSVTLTLFTEGFEGRSIWLSDDNVLKLHKYLSSVLEKRGVVDYV